MATANGQGPEKVVDMRTKECHLDLKLIVGDEKTRDVSLSNGKEDVTPEKLSDIESIDLDQPTGLMRMEAITMVWTKNWLITAYALYVAIQNELCYLLFLSLRSEADSVL